MHLNISVVRPDACALNISTFCLGTMRAICNAKFASKFLSLWGAFDPLGSNVNSARAPSLERRSYVTTIGFSCNTSIALFTLAREYSFLFSPPNSPSSSPRLLLSFTGLSSICISTDIHGRSSRAPPRLCRILAGVKRASRSYPYS